MEVGFADVTPALASAGYRIIVPFACGYGTTRFLSDDTPRNGQQAASAVDVTTLMDAFHIAQAILAGFNAVGSACWCRATSAKGPGHARSRCSTARRAARPGARLAGAGHKYSLLRIHMRVNQPATGGR